jgi:hypothetical protein
MNRRTWWVLALVAATAGCGGSQASVSGRVTLDGEPVDHGTVTFQPTGGGPVGYGVIRSGGSYSVQTGQQPGVAPGEYVVTVQSVSEVTEAQRQAAVSGTMTEATGQLLTPPRYASRETTPLRFQLKRGGNRVDLELTSQ